MIATTLNEHYKTSWSSFKSLEAMKLITKVGSKTYQNNEYVFFWVTEDDARVALCEGADQSSVVREPSESIQTTEDCILPWK